jgi:hypothetical protein
MNSPRGLFVRSRRSGIDDSATAVPATGWLAPGAPPWPTPGALLHLWARLAAPRLDLRIAAGADPCLERALACRSAQLVSNRSRRQLAGALERLWSRARQPAGFSAAIPCNRDAVQIARPALQQLATTLRSHDAVQARGVALTRLLLTDMCSALYRPAYTDQLYDVACEALSALDRHHASEASNARTQIELGLTSPS